MNVQTEQIIETLQKVESLTAEIINKDEQANIRRLILDKSKEIRQQTEIERVFGLNPVLFDLSYNR